MPNYETQQIIDSVTENLKLFITELFEKQKNPPPLRISQRVAQKIVGSRVKLERWRENGLIVRHRVNNRFEYDYKEVMRLNSLQQINVKL